MPSTSSRPHRLIAALGITALAAGCANPGEDVRLALCKDMVAVELGAEPTWTDTRIQTRGRDGAVATIGFSHADGRGGRAECHYRYDAVEDNMLTAADPLAAYSTSPSKMVLDGRTLTGQNLARTLGQAMRRQGRELLDRARETLGR